MTQVNMTKKSKKSNIIRNSICQKLALLGFKTQTEIQKLAMPILAEGKSLVGLAPTGSGKTLAFLLPLMGRIDVTISETQSLIIVPTRELGAQIAQVAQKVANILDKETIEHLIVRTAFGGQKSKNQKKELLNNPHIVIATPGRALEFLKCGALLLQTLISFVLDEADLMLGMGFEKEVTEICDFLPNKTQIALFSATAMEFTSKLQNRLTHRAQRIDVRLEKNQHQTVTDLETNQDIISIPEQISHQFITVSTVSDKADRLVNFISTTIDTVKNGIIFCQTRENVKQLTRHLRKESISVEELSGELGQVERFSVLRRFKAGGIKYLVATNIAGRGLDIKTLSIVINYDLPSTPKEYTHRVGRSGRAGNCGIALSFCTKQSESFLHNLVSKLSINLEPHNPVNFSNTSQSLAVSKTNPTFVCNFSKIHLNRGKSDNLRPGDILGSLTKDIGLKREDVGNILIFDHFTYVEINSDYVTKVIKRLIKSKIKNLRVKATQANKLSK